jgi:hypothetical protein
VVLGRTTNTHPALAEFETWEAAQSIGRQRGNVRDPLTSAKPGTRLYPFRARIRCKQCDRRMHGSVRPGRKPGDRLHLLCVPDPCQQPPARPRPPARPTPPCTASPPKSGSSPAN